MTVYLEPLAGGIIIGLAASLMLVLNGRIAGVSGIFNGALKTPSLENLWRVTFVLGLFFGGLVLRAVYPEALQTTLKHSTLLLVIAGLLVGFGTVMGNGCTSGHGICGVSRLSRRSIAATVTFLIFGMLTATMRPLLAPAIAGTNEPTQNKIDTGSVPLIQTLLAGVRL